MSIVCPQGVFATQPVRRFAHGKSISKPATSCQHLVNLTIPKGASECLLAGWAEVTLTAFSSFTVFVVLS